MSRSINDLVLHRESVRLSGGWMTLLLHTKSLLAFFVLRTKVCFCPQATEVTTSGGRDSRREAMLKAAEERTKAWDKRLQSTR
jgi:hypothetical protein